MNISRVEARRSPRKVDRVLRRHTGKKNEATKPTGWRLQKSLFDYVEQAAAAQRVPKTRVVEDALSMHRELSEKLSAHKPRFQRFALDEGLDWDTQETEVYARLIQRGLEQHEKQHK